MNIPMECLMCPEQDKAKCHDCWLKKVLKGEIKLNENEKAQFRKDYPQHAKEV